jgi:hypothetical protein
LRRPELLRLGLMLLGWLLFFALIFSMRYLTWARAEQSAVAGRQALARGDLAGAEAALLAARAADPANSLRPIALGDLAMLTDDHAAAAGWFAEGRTLEPRSLYALAMVGWLATLEGDQASAAAAHAAISAFGRDTNDFYSWAWEATPTPAPARLVPGAADALGHFVGFAPATPDLVSGRWTMGEARVRLGGAGCDAVRLLLRGPAGREVTLRSGEVSQTVVLSGIEQTATLALDRSICEPQAPLVVRITSARGLLDLEAAPWNVGVAVLSAERRP